MRYSRIGSNRIRNTVAILAAAGMLWMGSSQFVQAQNVTNAERDSSRGATCSNAAVAGEWAYTETGTLIPSTGAVPFAAVARYTLATDGDLSGTATSSSGGSISNVMLKGIGTVNPDCTGTLTVGVYASGNLVRTATFGIVYVDNAREGRAIVTSLVLANGAIVPAVLTVDARKLDHRLPRER
jgi:hypothetical protein